MDFSNKGGSVYHRLLALYLRTSEGEILRSIGQQSEEFQSFWPSMKDRVVEAAKDISTEPILSNLQVDTDSSDSVTVHVIEKTDPSSENIVGIVVNGEEDSTMISKFEKFFAKLMISQSEIDAKEPEPTEESEALTQKLTDLFDSHLRFEGKDDKWTDEGREYFAARVRHFTERNLRLDACLPAFPCKSSNSEKVTGEEPDKGEELALRRLHDFVQKVEEIYSPGARVWIISDGHVFSDCIGVDDTTVDMYGEKLQEMNEKISEELGSHDRVWFRSLVDIFDLRSHVDSLSEVVTDLNIPEIDHHIDTEHTEDAEVSRRILMAGCEPDPAALRARIDSNEKSIISLYRGFSRFMLEDLDMHPSTKELTKKKRKKLASSVSFEMIQRNQSYSNLVEMVFPDHLRLSIHAHNNAGPKFGIQLFDRDFVRATHDLEPDALKASSDDLLHIPTPWHNCVAEVAGDPTLHVVKSKVVEEALDTKAYDGGFVEGDVSDGKGGFFSLKDLTGKVVDKPVEGPIEGGADNVMEKTETSDSSASSATTTTVASDSSSAQSTGSDTDATSVDTVPTSKDNTETKDQGEKAASKVDTIKSMDKLSDKQRPLIIADDILNIPYLRLLGVDPDTLQELRDTVTQWAATVPAAAA